MKFQQLFAKALGFKQNDAEELARDFGGRQFEAWDAPVEIVRGDEALILHSVKWDRTRKIVVIHVT